MKARTGTFLFLAILSLAALGWWSRGSSAPVSASKAVLLTADWRPGGVEGVAVYRLPEAAPQAGAQVIPDVATLRRLVPGLRELAIHGVGVDAATAAVLRDVRVTWPDAAAAPAVPEISVVEFPSEIALGQPFRVSGRVAGLAAGAKIAVILDEPDGQPRRMDVVAGSDGAASFVLTGQPTTAAGRFLWRLRVGEAGASATLGAVVTPPRQPRVLLAQAAPTWELARLHEWLTRAGSAAVLRTRVSADRWRLVGGSGGQTESAALTPATLARFDVLVATEEALQALSADERVALEAAVRTEGLGLLVVGEPLAGAIPTAFTPWQITLAGQDADSMLRSTRVRLVTGREWAEPITVWAATWAERPLMRAVLRDPQGNVLAALEPMGRGRLARSLLAESWRWPLAGHAADYAALWRELLGGVARPAAINGAWQLVAARGVITVGQPVEVSWLGDAENALPSAQLSSAGTEAATGLRLAPLPNRPGEAWTRWWASRSGWHRLETNLGQGIDLYVSKAEEWPGVERMRRREVTSELVRVTAEVRAASSADEAGAAWIPWRWLAWTVFVGALGALWWRERSAA